jgi:hypothetical protein
LENNHKEGLEGGEENKNNHHCEANYGNVE